MAVQTYTMNGIIEADEAEAMRHLQFVKVTVRNGDKESSGLLTPISAKMLLVELRRNGLDVVARR